MRPVSLDHLDTNLLQVFRLAHAIAEAGVPVAIDREHRDRWAHVRRHLGRVPTASWRRGDPLDAIVDHATPRTAVGHVERPLVLPHAMTARCEQLWADRRPVAISFAGLMTPQRTEALAPLVDHFGEEFRVVATKAGRSWPGKAWDEEYYEVLGRSRLVACPDGDYVWTYRFFESALCGAVPVIQNDCPQYDGFRFHRMDGDPDGWEWDEQWARHNRALAVERLTVDHELLRTAVDGARMASLPVDR